MNWYANCSYHPERKQRFHALARARLRQLAAQLHWAKGSFDLRSNQSGIAVSGEITLHHAQVYIQVCQPATRCDTGILIRTCQDRRDYCGGPNHFEALSLLEDIPALAARVRAVILTSSGTAGGA